jgi:hypothetical protein
LTGADVFFGAVVFTAAFLAAAFFTAFLAIDSYYEPIAKNINHKGQKMSWEIRTCSDGEASL